MNFRKIATLTAIATYHVAFTALGTYLFKLYPELAVTVAYGSGICTPMLAYYWATKRSRMYAACGLAGIFLGAFPPALVIGRVIGNEVIALPLIPILGGGEVFAMLLFARIVRGWSGAVKSGVGFNQVSLN